MNKPQNNNASFFSADNISIEPMSVQQLLSREFLIPSYQRGYRWSIQQVKDLLEDLEDFYTKGTDGIYCLQPLVVKRNGQIWEVIDGQQRLTTINIILSCFKQNCYTLRYETREKSRQFLESILEKTKQEAEENIDYYHMIAARDFILQWKDSKEKKSKAKEEETDQRFVDGFIKMLLSRVKFLWYDTDTQDPISVFKRLNIDRIPLTSAELIKALLLNRSNFDEQNFERVRLFQQEIATQWDEIEYMMQNDEFWLFFHDDGQAPETRIDYIFEMMSDQRMLGEPSEDIGTDQSYVFRYYYDYFHRNKYNKETLQKVWKKVKHIYDSLNEWFNDLELYHYVGYLMARPKESTRQKGDQHVQQKLLFSLLQKWNEPGMTKGKFKDYLMGLIDNMLSECRDLDTVYETKGHPKTQCRPLLLLHNIETVIQQGEVVQSEYKQKIFGKFPFNLYKKEKWDVEHIDSNTSNDLSDFNSQKEWLLTNYIVATEDQRKDIKSFCVKMEDEERDEERNKAFTDLSESILSSDNIDDQLNEKEKNMVWNFTLLDEGTNRGYRNAIFPSKRRIIIGKEQGVYYPIAVVTKEGEILQPQERKTKSAFIPPCTKQVFMKYYSPISGIMVAWTKPDAEAYRQNILRVLSGKYNLKG